MFIKKGTSIQVKSQQLIQDEAPEANHLTDAQMIHKKKKSNRILKQDCLRNYLGSGSRVVDSSRNEHPSFAIDDQRSVIIADVERLEELGTNNEVVYQKNQ